MEPPRKKRRANISGVQKEILCAFLEKNELLRNKKFTASFTFQDAQKMWKELTSELNAIPGGAQKDWKTWRKTWQDWKSNTKVKAAQEKRSARETGGGRPVTILKESDSAVLRLISKVALEGDSEVMESPAFFEFGDDFEYVDMGNFSSNSDRAIVETSKCISTTPSNTKVRANSTVIPTYSPNPDRADVESSENITKTPSTTKVRTETTMTTDVPTPSKVASEKPLTGNKKRLMKKQIRFHETTKFTNKIADVSEQDMISRREYYAAKLKLLERDVVAKERIALACDDALKLLHNFTANITVMHPDDEDPYNIIDEE